jgi:hypothetical protein
LASERRFSETSFSGAPRRYTGKGLSPGGTLKRVSTCRESAPATARLALLAVAFLVELRVRRRRETPIAVLGPSTGSIPGRSSRFDLTASVEATASQSVVTSALNRARFHTSSPVAKD